MVLELSVDGMQADPSTKHDAGTCQVLSGNVAVIVQVLLFGICVSSLLFKWWMEVPRRKLQIFCLDSSKQFVGAGVIHVLNLMCAVAFTSMKESAADECSWYWINIMIDTTFGVGVCWLLLKATERLFGYDSGHYGKGPTGIAWETNPDFTKWLSQIMAWCLIVSTMKLFVVLIMWMFAPAWIHIAVACTHWIKQPTARLVFVMIFTPMCMNMFQFWVTDSFLKYSKSTNLAGKDMSVEEAGETTALRSGKAPVTAGAAH